ncbi:MAG: aminoglycoside phosphotransferase family protein [Acetatifactor sp.]|nr:aminoglycoside phosphotransferase family protein [Acetatifactor sp.]
MAITKNRQPKETIIDMAKKAFPEKSVVEIKELTEGMCNVTYHISFSDGTECILKIASRDQTGHLSNEVNLMNAEVKAMRLVSQSCSVKVADVLFYDCSKELCDGDYFFMEKLPGENYFLNKDKLAEETQQQIDEEIGVISRELPRITNGNFGFLGSEESFDSLYEFVKVMLQNLINDAEKKQVDIGYSAPMLVEELKKDKEAFAGVHTASLVHWDMWEGNVFIENNHVSGIIDWERAMWGEPFMDDRFRMHNRNENFLRGFGKHSFSKEELRRLRWYDIILYLTMMIEVFYREYEDQGQYLWAKEMLLKVL